jgi:PTH1 family peptidyl-tRNA hydrolase
MKFLSLRSSAKSGGIAWLLVFLGNPGPRYANTRHNVGYMTCDALSARLKIKVDRLKFKSLTATADLGGQRVLLMKPQTFMNLSGDAVRDAMRFYKVPPERVLVVCDDVALPEYKLRVRRSGSAGGHNGLKDIIAKCGGDSGGEGFPRIKIGVGSPPHPDMDLADYVLGAYTAQSLVDIQATCARAADAAETIIRDGIDAAMGKYN